MTCYISSLGRDGSGLHIHVERFARRDSNRIEGLTVPDGLRAYHCNRIEGFTALTGLMALLP